MNAAPSGAAIFPPDSTPAYVCSLLNPGSRRSHSKTKVCRAVSRGSKAYARS